MAGLLAFGPAAPARVRDPAAARLDAASAALSVAGVLVAVYGFKRAAQDVADATARSRPGSGWARRPSRAAAARRPVDRPGLLRRRTFSLPLSINACSFFVLYGTQFLIAQYLQLVLGLSALEAGLWTIPSALGYLAGSCSPPRRANACGAVDAERSLAVATATASGC